MVTLKHATIVAYPAALSRRPRERLAEWVCTTLEGDPAADPLQIQRRLLGGARSSCGAALGGGNRGRNAGGDEYEQGQGHDRASREVRGLGEARGNHGQH